MDDIHKQFTEDQENMIAASVFTKTLVTEWD